ncbi:MAG: nuclear transport factor 2 family protein [Pseudomonadota bacterium]
MGREDLEKRLRILEDTEAIRNLKALYGEICDDSYRTDRMRELFTPDAIWDGGDTWGVYHGIDRIMAFFDEAGKSITGVHFFVQPKIKIISETQAEASWYLLQQGTKGDMAFWLSAMEYEKYEKIGGKWLFKEIKFIPFFATRYEVGWHKEKMCL